MTLTRFFCSFTLLIFTLALAILGPASPGACQEGPPPARQSAGISPDKWFRAVKTGDVKKIKEMIAAGFKIDHRNSKKQTALHLAIESNQNAVAKLLLENKASFKARDDRNCFPLIYCAIFNNAKAAELLLKAGAKVDDRGFVSQDGDAQSTALIFAAEMGSLETAKVLIKYGADVNAVNNFKRTPLFWAQKAGKTEVARLLRANGATVKGKAKE